MNAMTALRRAAAGLPEPESFESGVDRTGDDVGQGAYSVLAFRRCLADFSSDQGKRQQTHFRHVLVFCLAGCVERWENGTAQAPLRPGQACLVRPYVTHHHWLAVPGSEMLAVTFEWRGRELEGLGEHVVALTPDLVRDLNQFVTGYDAAAAGLAARRIALRLDLALLGMSELAQREAEHREVAAEKALGGRVTKLVQERIGSLRSMQDVAAGLGMSAESLRAKFAKLGMGSLGKYLTEAPFLRARHLLVASDKSAGEICALCGFSSEPTFNRNFKQRYGETPMRYRRAAGYRPLAAG